MKRILAGLAIFLCVVGSLRAQSDPTLTLAQILSDKGTITVAELGRVQSAEQSVRLSTLVAILSDKGLLNNQDVAKIALPPAPSASPAAAASSPVVTARAPKPAPLEVPVTTKKGLPVSLYGSLLFTTGYNTAAFNIEDLPMIASKQGSDPTGGDKNFYASARQTRLGMNLNPIATLGGKLSGTFEFDLTGGSAPYPNGLHFDLFRLRLAYGRLDWKNFAIVGGQDYSIFAPLMPTSMNEAGIPEFTATGNAWARQPQVRFETKTTNASGNNILWQVAAADPNIGDLATTTLVAVRLPSIGERGRMPSLQSRLAFTKSHNDRDFTVGVSGLYQRGKNAGVLSGLNLQSPVDEWGVALDYSLPISKLVSITGEAYEGRALGIYGVALGESVGAVGTAGAHGVLSRGGWTQLQFNWNKQWQTNVGYGVDQPKATNLPVGNRERNQQYMANVIDRLTRNINASIEYRRIITDYRNQLSANERGDHMDLGLAFIF